MIRKTNIAMRVSKSVKPAFFVILFILLLSFFSYIFFPYGRLKTPLENLFYERTGMHLNIKKIYYGFPFNIKLSSITSKEFSARRAKADISPVVLLNYIIFKNILLNINLSGVKIKDTFGKGEINLGKISLNFGVIKSGASGGLSGKATFNGDAEGYLKIKKAAVRPFEIFYGVLKLKIKNKIISKKYGLLLKTLFKKSKNGYYIYYLKDIKGQI